MFIKGFGFFKRNNTWGWLSPPMAKRGGTSFLLLKVGGDHGAKVLFDKIIMLMLQMLHLHMTLNKGYR